MANSLDWPYRERPAPPTKLSQDGTSQGFSPRPARELTGRSEGKACAEPGHRRWLSVLPLDLLLFSVW